MIRDRIIKINNMISKIKDKQILKEIFYIVQPELQSSGECKYSHNDNGIFFDLKLLSDITLEKIEELVKQNLSIIHTETDSINYSAYCNEELPLNNGPKLNNIERNLMINKQKNNL